jgi:hypothetical protein
MQTPRIIIMVHVQGLAQLPQQGQLVQSIEFTLVLQQLLQLPLQSTESQRTQYGLHPPHPRQEVLTTVTSQ